MVVFFAKVMVFNLYQEYALNQVLYFHCSINIYPSSNAIPSRICLISNTHVYQTFPRNMHTLSLIPNTTVIYPYIPINPIVVYQHGQSHISGGARRSYRKLRHRKWHWPEPEVTEVIACACATDSRAFSLL